MIRLMASLEKAMVKLRRKRISRALFNAHAGVVQKGPFKGLKLGGDANTSAGNLGAKIFGLYEAEVMETIRAAGPFECVVNFGAADGYFSLGMLVGGLAQRSICFELTEKGRAAIRRNALENDLVARVEVFGAVDDGVGATLAQHAFDPARTLVVCDIEGAEFSVLTEKLLGDLKGAMLIVELHDRMMTEGLALRSALIGRLPAGARHEILVSQPKDWRGIGAIEALEDNDRALVTSDGRKVLGEWLVVTYPEA